MRFLVDANLPPSLATWLASLGHEAKHAAEVGLESASDRRIWSHAAETGSCVVTKDEDFVLLKMADPTGPRIVWVRIGNAVRRVLIEKLTGAWPAVIRKLEEGEGVIEIR